MRSHPKIAENDFLSLTRIVCILQKKVTQKSCRSRRSTTFSYLHLSVKMLLIRVNRPKLIFFYSNKPVFIIKLEAINFHKNLK
ncbi:hypothetical protein TSAR_005481 [Trichomalopsis sarcophagae]|uniref:Uncharacterized protein n=1 Tax=Trichomalopsis sarcophagae TaxID=543379 RepID=A0A232EZH5_9HYME|nr:hypothetical protein TSAR_005481 [Trichomalopsis sarcophagae]